MVMISDILYFASIDESLHPLITTLYERDPKVFHVGSSLLFDMQQRNILNSIVGEPAIQDTSLQKRINLVMECISNTMHIQLSAEGRSFLHSKGITDEQIEVYRLGDSSVLETHYVELFHNLSQNHNKDVLNLVSTCLSKYRSAIISRYKSPLFISYPSYVQGALTGVVFRTVGFEKREGQMRNMFKFYSPYNYSFLFNEQALQDYEEINVVEGVSDALALIRLGYLNTVSPSMVRLSPGHIAKLKNKRLNILFDRDMGGYAGVRYIMDRIPAEQLNVVALTPNERDFDEENADVIHSYMSNLVNFDIRSLV